MSILSCEQVRDLLPEWTAGELGGETRTALAAHLQRCVECRDEAAVLAALGRSLAPVPAALEWRVLSATRQARPARRWSPARQLAAAATLAAMVLGGSLLIELAGGERASRSIAESGGSEGSSELLLPAVEDPVLPGRSVLQNLTDAELESLLARMES